MKSGGWLKTVRTHEEQRQEWRTWLRSALPEELRAAVVDANLKGGVLLVQAASAGWASRLRFALPALAEPLRKRWPAIAAIKVRVTPSTARR